MTLALEATFYRTMLLLGLVRGEAVHAWADGVIAGEAAPPPAMFEVVSVAPADLTELRHALWPLVIEPDPPEVLEAVFGVLHADLEAGRRAPGDILTVVRQMRSMLRLPRATYDIVNGLLAEYDLAVDPRVVLTRGLAALAGGERGSG